MWINLRADIADEFARYMKPASAALAHLDLFYNLPFAFRVVDTERIFLRRAQRSTAEARRLSDPRKAEDRRRYKLAWYHARMRLSRSQRQRRCSECQSLIPPKPPGVRGRIPVVCSHPCKLRRLYRLRRHT